MNQSDPKPEIKPTLDHLSDPFVLQLIEAIGQRDDHIEELEAEVKRWKDSHDTAVAAAYKKRCELEAEVAGAWHDHGVMVKQYEYQLAEIERLTGDVAAMGQECIDLRLDRERLRAALEQYLEYEKDFPLFAHMAREALAAVEGQS